MGGSHGRSSPMGESLGGSLEEGPIEGSHVGSHGGFHGRVPWVGFTEEDSSRIRKRRF